MPKKSKKEKIIAELRRRARETQSVQLPPSPSPIRQTESTFQFRAPAPTTPTVQKYISSDRQEIIAIRKDLVKTIILAVIAISAEFALYWFGKGKI